MIQSVSSFVPSLRFPIVDCHLAMLLVFNPEIKNGDRRIQFVQHLQNVVAPNIFHPRIVYDGRALAYSPGRPLHLAGGTGETVSSPFLFHCAIKLMYIILVLSSHELQRSGASGIEGGRTDSVYPDKRYSRPANVSTTSSF